MVVERSGKAIDFVECFSSVRSRTSLEQIVVLPVRSQPSSTMRRPRRAKGCMVLMISALKAVSVSYVTYSSDRNQACILTSCAVRISDYVCCVEKEREIQTHGVPLSCPSEGQLEVKSHVLCFKLSRFQGDLRRDNRDQRG